MFTLIWTEQRKLVFGEREREREKPIQFYHHDVRYKYICPICWSGTFDDLCEARYERERIVSLHNKISAFWTYNTWRCILTGFDYFLLILESLVLQGVDLTGRRKKFYFLQSNFYRAIFLYPDLT